jgi:type I restriction enzyme S subunit
MSKLVSTAPAQRRKGWTRVAFGDVVRLSKARSSDPSEDGFDRYVGLEHLDPGDLKVRHWGNVANGTTFTSVFRAGQVLFGKRRAYQRKVALADFDGVCSGDIYVLEAKNEHLLPELLPFICQTDGFFDHAIGTSAGSLSPRTNWKSLANYEFALPPLEEQQRIAEVLQNIQRSVASYTESMDAAVRLMQSVSCSRFSGLLKRSDVPVRPLGELLEEPICNGIFRTRDQFGSGARLINVTDIYKGFCLSVDSLERVPATEAEYSSFSAVEGDVIFNRSSLVESGIGHACLVPALDERLVFECHLMRVRANPHVLQGAYLARYALSPPGRRYLLARAQTTTMTTIGQSDLSAMPVPCVDIRAQAVLVDELDRIERAGKAVAQRLEDLNASKTQLVGQLWK